MTAQTRQKSYFSYIPRRPNTTFVAKFFKPAGTKYDFIRINKKGTEDQIRLLSYLQN